MARNTSFTLSDHFVEFIDELVASGRYGSASEVVREGLRLVEERQQHLDWLREQIAEADADFEAGRVYEDSDEFWETLAEQALKRHRNARIEGEMRVAF